MVNIEIGDESRLSWYRYAINLDYVYDYAAKCLIYCGRDWNDELFLYEVPTQGHWIDNQSSIWYGGGML